MRGLLRFRDCRFRPTVTYWLQIRREEWSLWNAIPLKSTFVFRKQMNLVISSSLQSIACFLLRWKSIKREKKILSFQKTGIRRQKKLFWDWKSSRLKQQKRSWAGNAGLCVNTLRNWTSIPCGQRSLPYPICKFIGQREILATQVSGKITDCQIVVLKYHQYK